METHASVAEVDATGKVTVHTCSQAPHLHQMFVAGILSCRSTRCGWPAAGSAAGSARAMTSAWTTSPPCWPLKTQRPVKWVLTREEEMLSTSKDQAYLKLHFTSAVKKDGTIIGRQVEAVQDTGAYNIFGSGGSTRSRSTAAGRTTSLITPSTAGSSLQQAALGFDARFQRRRSRSRL